MHYIPESKYTDEDGDESQSSSRMSLGRSRRSKSSKNNKKRPRGKTKTRPVAPTPPPPNRKAPHQKVGKKLRSIVTRAFTKHKDKPLSHAEQDALLQIIHCDPNQNFDCPSIDSASNSYGTQTSNWSKAGYNTPTNSLNDPSVILPEHDDDDDSTVYEQETPKERARRIQAAQDKIRQAMAFPLWECILAIVFYVVLSVVCFSLVLEKDWTLLDSSYFAVVTFTTIGYGDVVPDTLHARLFTCVWALSGVASLGIALGVLGSNLISTHEQDMVKRKTKRESNVIGLFDHHLGEERKVVDGDESTQTSHGYSTIEEGRRRVMFDHIDDSDDETNPRFRRGLKDPCWKRCCTWHVSAILLRWTLLLAYITGVLYLIAQNEGWNLSMTVYYGLITASTVGYGDFCPHTETGRFLAILYIPVAVGIMGCFLDMIAGGIIRKRREKFADELQNRPLTMSHIRLLDTNGDGEVSRAEFLEFMLVAMDQVDTALLDRLNANFNRLDVDGSGVINKADLAYLAKERMAKAQADLGEKYRPYEPKNYLAEQARSHHYQTSTNSPISSIETCGSSLPKPNLERNTTKQTSNITQPTNNRTSGGRPPTTPTSYQHQPNYGSHFYQ